MKCGLLYVCMGTDISGQTAASIFRIVQEEPPHRLAHLRKKEIFLCCGNLKFHTSQIILRVTQRDIFVAMGCFAAHPSAGTTV